MRFYTSLACGLCVLTLIAAGPRSEFWTYYTDHANGAPEPDFRRNIIHVCQNAGCNLTYKFRLSRPDMASLARIMSGAISPAGERSHIRKAIAWTERRVGTSAGTAGDKAEGNILWGGIFGQLDCVAEAINSTNIMRIMEARGMMKYHTVLPPDSRGFLFSTHNSAMIMSRRNGALYAVDSYFGDNGTPPDITPKNIWSK